MKEAIPIQTRYPEFDVMDEAEAWDAHTRDIVQQRLVRPSAPKHLTRHEAETIRAIAQHLLYEDREEILSFIVSHFDKMVGEPIGESERQVGVPPGDKLIKGGVAALDAVAKSRFGRKFLECDGAEGAEILTDLQQGRLEAVGPVSNIPQKQLFRKLLATAVEAYASHPRVWSDIGYAGPAYPRGYYRIERGLRDPWEPPFATLRRPAGQEES